MTTGEPRPAHQPVPGCGIKARAAHKETRRLLAEIKKAGGQIEPSRSRDGHFKIYLDGEYIGGLAGTPSDRRAYANDIARLRRNGLPITSKGRHRP